MRDSCFYACSSFGKETDLIGSLYEYCRIIVHSFGHKAESNDSAPLMRPSCYVETVRVAVFVAPASRAHSDSDHGGVQCMEAALALLNLWLNDMHSIGHVPFAPDFFFVGTGFAGAFLLEVCFPFSTPRLTRPSVLTLSLAPQATYCSHIDRREARVCHSCMQEPHREVSIGCCRRHARTSLVCRVPRGRAEKGCSRAPDALSHIQPDTVSVSVARDVLVLLV